MSTVEKQGVGEGVEMQLEVRMQLEVGLEPTKTSLVI